MGLFGNGRWLLGLSARHKNIVIIGIILAGILFYYQQWLAALGTLGLIFIWSQLN